MKRPTGPGPALLLVVVGAVLWPAPDLSAQGVELRGAERLVEEGRFAEARELVAGWWNDAAPGAPRDQVQLGLWLRGLLTIDPSLSELDFRRLVVEYPGGRYSDEALLRLAKGSEARGDPAAARGYLEILLRDYPQSPLRVESRSRLARLPEGVPPLSPPSPPAPRAETRQEAPAEVEVEWEPEVGAAEDSDASYSIQLGAFSTLERARSLAEIAGEAGLAVRIVKVEGSELVRVRLGAFFSRDEAEEEARAVRALRFEAVISSDRTREVEAR